MPTTRRVGRPPARTATGLGARIRAARLAVGWTQQQLAGERFSKAYVSALENGLVQPSMAALAYLAERLGTSPATLVTPVERTWTRLEADVALAAGDWTTAAEGYGALLESTVEPLGRAELLRGRAEALCSIDRGREAIAPAAEALELFTRAGRAADAALATYWLSAAHYMSDALPEARALLERLLGAADPTGGLDPDLHVKVLVALAAVEGRAGRQEQALAVLAEAQTLAGGFDDLRRASYTWALAVSYRELGDLEAALRYGQQTLALYRAAAAERDEASIGNEVALTYLALGNTDAAARYAEAAAATLERLADERKLAHVVDTQAQVALARDDPAIAINLATRAVALAEATGNGKALVDALATRARAEAASGTPQAAVADYERAVAVATSFGSVARRAEVLRAWADLAAAQGDHPHAYQLMKRAVDEA